MSLPIAETMSGAVAITTLVFGYVQWKGKTRSDEEIEKLKLEIDNQRALVESKTQQEAAEEAAWARFSRVVSEQDARIALLVKSNSELMEAKITERRECTTLIEAAREEMQVKLKQLRNENDADQTLLRASIKELQRLCSDQDSQIQSQQVLIERLERRRAAETEEPTGPGMRRATDPVR